jgi:hypothetical protein
MSTAVVGFGPGISTAAAEKKRTCDLQPWLYQLV